MFKFNNNDTRTYFTLCSIVSIVNFEQVNVCWVIRGIQREQQHEMV